MYSLVVGILYRAFSTDITPTFPVEIGGYKMTRKNVTEVLDQIEVNCLILKSKSEFLVIMSFDLLYCGSELRSRLEAAVSEFGIEPKNIILCASHTHHAPMVDPSKPLLGRLDERYLDWLTGKVISELRSAIRSKFLPFVAELGYGQSSRGVSRRSIRLKAARVGISFFGTFVMKPNPNSEIDRTLRRLILKNPRTGRTVTEIWSFGVHATARKMGNYISADFPGYVRKNIRNNSQSDIPVLFLQGFSGDVRPNSGSDSSLFSKIKTLINGGSFQELNDKEYLVFGNLLSDELLSIKTISIPNLSRQSFKVSAKTVPPNFFTRNFEATENAFIQVIYFGDITLFGVPAEVVSEYATDWDFNARNIWPIGCINHVFAYVPSSKMIAEGGYEVEGFRKYFGCGPVNPEVETELRSILQNI